MNFLCLSDIAKEDYPQIIKRAIEVKKSRAKNPDTQIPTYVLKGKSLIMLFSKESTRTRISFEIGINQLGGNSLFIQARESQMARGEPIKDTATIMSSMADGIIIRNNSHNDMKEFAKYSKVPVINALSSDYHPCQVLSDMMTYFELRGDISGKKVVWCGDGNNMCNSYIEAAQIFDFKLSIVSPPEYHPSSEMLERHGGDLEISQDIEAAMQNADLICTDVWVSMGDEDADTKRKLLTSYQVTPELLALANDDALFMHCLPAVEGEEVSQGLLDHPKSAVWTQGENRLHAQKALLEYLYKA